MLVKDRLVDHLPTRCFSTQNILNIGGVVVHFISAIGTNKPEDKYNMETIYDLFVELNIPEQRGVLLNKDRYGTDPKEDKIYASAHFLVGRDGDILETVPIHRKAWHAGSSSYQGRNNLNKWTIGIELVGMLNHGFEMSQYISLVNLVRYIQNKSQANFTVERNFTSSGVIGHEHIAMPLGRKADPGKKFDWMLFWDMYGV